MTLKAQFEEIKRNKLAAAILLGGVLAFILVSVLAFQTFFSGSNVPEAEISKEEIEAFKDSANQTQANVEPQQAEKKTYRRQEKISEKQIIGSWTVPLRDGRALLEMRGGTYRLIIVPNGGSRWYSNGRYEMKDDLLVLSPNLEWGPPKSRQFGYRVLTRADIPVMVAKYRGRLVWQVPGDDVDVYVPSSHPFLKLTQDNIAVWNVLK